MSTSKDVLMILEKKRGRYASGTEIAEELGISKNAVWKAVRKLQSEGHIIEAVTHRGYRLSDESDVLTTEGIYAYLDQMCIDQDLRIEVFDSVGSTNNICISKAGSGEASGYVAAAAMQTGGKGRRGRSFYSPADTGLYISILVRPEGYTPEQAVSLTTMTAVAVCEAIESVSGRDASIKWVNDIFMDGRKVCGILTEASFDMESGTLDYAVIGTGINVYTPDSGFPAEIDGIAGSIFGPRSLLTGSDSHSVTTDIDRPGSQAGSGRHDLASGYGMHNTQSVSDMHGFTVRSNIRNRLAAEILNRFMYYYNSCSCFMHIEEYRKRCMIPGRDILVLMAGRRPRPAKALGIDDRCGLIVRYKDGTEETLTSGEISIRLQQPQQ